MNHILLNKSETMFSMLVLMMHAMIYIFCHSHAVRSLQTSDQRKDVSCINFAVDPCMYHINQNLNVGVTDLSMAKITLLFIYN